MDYGTYYSSLITTILRPKLLDLLPCVKKSKEVTYLEYNFVEYLVLAPIGHLDREEQMRASWPASSMML